MFVAVIALVILFGARLVFKSPMPDKSVAVTENVSREKGANFKRKPTRSSVDDSASRTDDLARLKTALQQEDVTTVQALFAKLTQDLIDHPEHLDEILQSLKTETDPLFLAYISRIIEGGNALGNKAVTDTALEMAQNGVALASQHAGLLLLEKVPEIAPDVAEKVNHISREAGDILVRTSAMATMTSWMTDHPQMATGLAGELLKTIEASNSLEVRANGLLFVAAHIKQLPENFTTTMADYLHDSSHYLRTTAAEALGKAPETMKSFVVPHLEQAFAAETDLIAQRTILTAIVRAGKGDAGEILKRLSPTGDVKELQSILERGLTDPNEIIQEKAKLDSEKGRPLAADTN
ncbi:MAG: hypothetical protein ACR2H1_04755 [Limisphaerales bacterium]